MIFLLNVDENINFEALKGCFVVYIGSHGDEGAKRAEIVLPGLAYSEKEAIYVNLEGRPQKTVRAIFGPENAIDDALLIGEIATQCDLDLGFKDLQGLENEIVKNYPNLGKLNEISSRKWQKSAEISSKASKIIVKDYDFYQSNAIARASKSLVKCSNISLDK